MILIGHTTLTTNVVPEVPSEFPLTYTNREPFKTNHINALR